ncbi:MAG: hypothetical protein IPJ69_00385 [Deltaproteobacteria bacterium]|nr:MAG: hypothetical protein IPJ69_00385 [Deltaproteobacteria bacterium]
MSAQQVPTAPILSLPNETGMNSYTPMDFFSQGESISVSDGQLVLNPNAASVDYYQTHLTVTPTLSPNPSVFGDPDITISAFNDNDNASVMQEVWASPSDNPIGKWGRFISTHQDSHSVGKIRLSDHLQSGQFGVDGLIGAIQVNFPSVSGSAYYLLQSDGKAVYVDNFQTTQKQQERGFRNVYKIVDGYPTFEDKEGNRYRFSQRDGFRAFESSGPITTSFQGRQCYRVFFFFQKCTTFDFAGWHVAPLYLTMVEDKFGNQVTIHSQPGPEGFRSQSIITTPKMKVGFLESDTQVQIRTQYDETRPLEDTGGKVWNYSFDEEGRISEARDPEGNAVHYRMSLSDLPVQRRLGSVVVGEPDSVMEVSYPTGAVFRYESFYQDRDVKAVIVTEFPNRRDPSQFYQRYYVATGEHTDVYDTDGTLTRYGFSDTEGQMLISSKTVSFNGHEIRENYEWQTQNIGDAAHPATLVLGVRSLENIVDGVSSTVLNEYDAMGRVHRRTVSALSKVSDFSYYGDTDYVSSIQQNKTVNLPDGTAREETVTSRFLDQSQTGCRLSYPERRPSDPQLPRGFTLGRVQLESGHDTLEVSRYCYDRYGNRIREVQGLHRTSEFIYDLCRSLSAPENCSDLSEAQRALYLAQIQKSPASSGSRQEITQFGYQLPLDFMSSMTTPNGATTLIDRNRLGQIAQITFPSSSLFQDDFFFSERADLPPALSAFAGKNIRRRRWNDVSRSASDDTQVDVFDGLGLLTEEHYNDGGVRRYQYGPKKKPTLIQEPDGRATRFVYDGLGRVVQVIRPGGEVFDYVYSRVSLDHWGHTIPMDTVSVSQNGHVLLTKYFDSEGHLIRMDRGEGSESQAVRYRYDQIGNLTGFLTPTGLTTTHVYDPFSRLISRNYPDGSGFRVGSFENNFYSHEVNFSGTVSGVSRQRTIDYDSANRVTRIVNGDVPAKIFHYDEEGDGRHGLGQLTSAEDESGRSDFFYDAAENVSKVSQHFSPLSLTSEYPFSYQKNGFGGDAFVEYPDGRRFFVKTDARGRILEVREREALGPVIVSYAYQALGNLVASATFGNGIRQEYVYFDSGRIQQFTLKKGDSVLAREAYRYDSRGNKTRVIRLDGTEIGYTYDSLNRLVRADYFHARETAPFNSQVYHYDGDNHRISYEDAFKTEHYVLDATHANRLSEVDQGDRRVSFEYDAFGNRHFRREFIKGREILTHEYQFDDQNRLIRLEINDRRQGRASIHGVTPPLVITYTYDHLGRRTSKRVQGETKYYLYGESLDPAMELSASGSFAAAYAWAGALRIAKYENGSVLYFHADELGSTRYVTNASGDLVQSFSYDPFGNVNAAVGSEGTSYRFAGKEQDAESGLIYFGARYYDPEVGEFLSQDPAESSLNSYGYVDNNPIALSDQFGLFSSCLSGYAPDLGIGVSDCPPGGGGSGFGSGSGVGGGIYTTVFSTGGSGSGRGSGSGLGNIGSTTSSGSGNGSGPGTIYIGVTIGGGGGVSVGVGSDGGDLTQAAENFFNLIGDAFSWVGRHMFGIGIPSHTHLDRPPSGFQPGYHRGGDGNVSTFNHAQAGAVESVAQIGHVSLPTIFSNPAPQSIPVQTGLKNSLVTSPVQSAVASQSRSSFSGGAIDPRGALGGSPALPDGTGAPSSVSGFSETSDRPNPQAQETHTSNNRNQNDVGDPVLLHSGDFHQMTTDLKIPGIGMDYEFRRTYRSRIQFLGPMGFNWDHNYDKRLVEQRNAAGVLLGIARFDGEDRYDFYRYDATSDRFETPAGFFDELTKASDGTYTIRDRHGMLSHYDADGFVTDITDRNGNALHFSYTMVAGVSEKRLSQVTDTLSRAILYHYYESGTSIGLLFKVTDFASREVVFTYDDHRDLISVRSPVSTDFPSGKTVHYTYSSGFAPEHADLNHNLLTVTNAKGQTYLENVYSTEDRVSSQRFGNEGVFHFTYHHVASLESCAAADVDTVIYRTDVMDRSDNLTGWEFNCQGNPLTKREYTRGVRSEDPSSYVTRYRYNRHGLVTTMTLPQGNTLRYWYAEGAGVSRLAEGNLLEIVKEKDSTRSGGNPIRIVMEYEPVYNQLRSIIDPRGNDATFLPSNGGDASPARYTETRYFDYQEGSVAQLAATLHKTTLQTTALLGAVSVGLGDLNGDGDTSHASGNLVKVTFPSPRQMDASLQTVEARFRYNDAGQIARVEHPSGASDVYEYFTRGPERGYLSTITQDVGHENITQNFTYDSVGNPLSFTDGRRHVYRYEVNALNQILTETSPIGHEKRFAYDANDNLVSLHVQNRNEDGVVSTTHPWVESRFAYDSLDHMVSKTEDVSPSHSVLTEYQYDLNENLVRVIQPEGNSIKIDYDDRDLPARLIRGFESSEATTFLLKYDANRNLKTMRDGGGHDWNYDYDGFDRLLRAVSPTLDQTLVAYDPSGDVSSISKRGPPRWTGLEVLLAEEHLIHDEQHRLLVNQKTLLNESFARVRDVVTQFQYDAQSRLIQLQDDNNHVSRFGYDGLNRLIQFTDALGNQISNTYDAANNLTRRRSHEVAASGFDDFENNYRYDSLNRLIRMTDTLGQTSTYSYDSRSNLTATSDPKENVSHYTYDALNRRVRSSLELRNNGVGSGALLGTINTDYEYDDNSRLIRMTDDNHHATTFDYDHLNRKVRTHLADSSVYRYTYDTNDNLSRYEDPKGFQIDLHYDAAHRLTVKDITQDHASQGREVMAYDGLSRLVRASVEDETGATSSDVQFHYDSLNRILRETQDGHDVVSAYDGVGNQTDLTYPAGRVIHQVFDAINQLDSIQNDLSTDIITQTHLGMGRPAARRFENGTTTTWSYDAVKRMASVNHVDSARRVLAGFNYGYDRSSNRLFEADLQDGGRARVHRYDSVQRLFLITEVRRKSDRSVIATYRYDALGRRIEKTVSAATTHYFYKGAQVLEEHDASGALQAQYLYGEGVDDVVSMERGGHTYHYHADSLGNIVAVSDESGVVVERYHYNAYGRVSISDGSGAPLTHTAIGNSFLFNGHTFDAETGLYYYRARYYDPNIGRFLQRDPMGFIDGVNVYAYTRNNPINGLDPFGFNTTSSQGNSAAGNPYGNPWGQNSWLGTLTGRPIMTPTGLGADVFQTLNLHTGNSYIDPTLGLVNDVFNISGNMANGVLGGFAHGVGFVDEMLAKTGCDLQCIAITEQASGIPLGQALSGMTQGLKSFGTVERSISRGVIIGEELPSTGMVQISNNSLPTRVARVINSQFSNSPTLGGPASADVFVTPAEDIAGISNSLQLAERLTLWDETNSLIPGPYTVIEFDTPTSGLASPYNRTNPGFINGGYTQGGAAEFILPNLKVDELQNVTKRMLP